jgi:uncharacterized protein DUF402
MIRREVLNDGRVWLEAEVELVLEDNQQFVTYLPGGAELRYPLGFHPWYPKAAWQGHGVLMLHRPADWYSVWVFWQGDGREFAGWYVNFQEPYRRWADGYDTQDLELDIWIPKDGPWQWKDRELLEERVREGRFTEEQVRVVRAEGERVAADLDAGRRWWDPGWAEWSPA